MKKSLFVTFGLLLMLVPPAQAGGAMQFDRLYNFGTSSTSYSKMMPCPVMMAGKPCDRMKKNMPMPHEDMAGMHHENLYAPAMNTMHAGMAAVEPELTGDVESDFVRLMIPHHQGAIDMAKVLVKKTRSGKIHRLGHDVITAQKREIRMMEKWLARHGK